MATSATIINDETIAALLSERLAISIRQDASAKVYTTYQQRAPIDRSTILLDPGANGHIFNDKKLFTKFVSVSLEISTAGEVSPF